MTGNMQHVNNMPKGPMMYGSDAIGGLASSANQLVCFLRQSSLVLVTSESSIQFLV